MAIHAVIEILADRSPDQWWERIHSINPVYGPGFADRRPASDPQSPLRGWRGDVPAGTEPYHPSCGRRVRELGINLMRLGQDEEAASS